MLRKLLIKYLDKPSWPAVAVDVVFITMLTFGFLWLLEYDPYSILEPTGDFSSGDYYDRLYHRNVDLPVDTNVVIVATDDISAAGMPDALRLVASFEPAAIGLDLIFRTQGSVTDDLLDVIDSIPIIVLPVELAYDDATDRLSRQALCHRIFSAAGTPLYPARVLHYRPACRRRQHRVYGKRAVQAQKSGTEHTSRGYSDDKFQPYHARATRHCRPC